MILSWISARGFSRYVGFPRSFSVKRGKYCKDDWRRQSNVMTDLNTAEKELDGTEKKKLSLGIYPSAVRHKSISYVTFSSPLSSLFVNGRRNGVSIAFGEPRKPLMV